MGYLVHLLLALVAHGLAEQGLTLPFEQPLLVLLLAAVPYVLAALARRASLRGRFARASLLLGALHWCPPALHALSVCALSWTRSVDERLGFAVRLYDWPQPAVFVALAPFLVLSVLSIDARARGLGTRQEAMAHARRFQMRMFASGLAPLVVYVLLAWAIGSDAVLRARVEHVGLYGALFAGSLLLLFLALLPFLLARTWDTEPLRPGPLRDLLEALGRLARFRCREILLWRTGEQMANAAVVGIAPRLRVVLLSDVLLGQLLPRETLAVFAHEIGHAKHHHVLVFVCWTVAFFLGADLVAQHWLPPGELAAMGLLGGLLVVWYLAFGWLSRRFELDADLYSVELTGDVDAMVGALEQVGGPHGRGRRSWRHFSTRQRVEFLERHRSEPAHGARLRRQLRRFALAGGALAVAAILAQGAGLVADLPEDLALADLALGRYAQAAERLDGVDAPDEDLARTVELVASLDARGIELDARGLELEALAALRAGADQAAADLVEVALLRGAVELQPLRDVLAGLVAGEPLDVPRVERLRDALGAERGAWVEALLLRARG